jgi:hypothetical protein
VSDREEEEEEEEEGVDQSLMTTALRHGWRLPSHLSPLTSHLLPHQKRAHHDEIGIVDSMVKKTTQEY